LDNWIVCSKCKIRGRVLGIIFVVIGITIISSGYINYETWFELLEENINDQTFQNNFSVQLDFHKITMVEGILVLGSGAYFFYQKILEYITQRLNNHKELSYYLKV
jgi:hypothetical protein